RAEASATNQVVRFQNRHLDELAGNEASALSRLVLRDIEQRVAVDCFDKAIAENICRHAEGRDVFTARNTLLRLWADRAIVDQRTVRDRARAVVDGDCWIYKVAKRIRMPHAQLTDLADAAGNRILMAISARFVVVDRA